jgi:hypothetical protein
MPDWLCSPHTCYMAAWFYDYQRLIAGVAAVATAIVVVFVPEFFRLVAERKSQSQRSNQVAIDIAFLASHLSAELLKLRDARKERRLGIAHGVHLPTLNSLVGAGAGHAPKCWPATGRSPRYADASCDVARLVVPQCD